MTDVKPPEYGEEFVWMFAEKGKWGELIENVHEVLETLPRNRWLVQWLDDDGTKMMTLVHRNSEGKLERAD